MKLEELYLFYVENLPIKYLKRNQSIAVEEDWWAKKIVFGIFVGLILSSMVAIMILSWVVQRPYLIVFMLVPMILLIIIVSRNKFGQILISDLNRGINQMNYQTYIDIRLKDYLNLNGYITNDINDSQKRLEGLANFCLEQHKRYKPVPNFVFFTVAFGAVFAVVQPFISEVASRSKDLLLTAIQVGGWVLVALISVAYLCYWWKMDKPFNTNKARAERYYILYYKLKCIIHEQQLLK